jgi:hypothetical protein
VSEFATGRVERLYVNATTCHVRLRDVPVEPSDNYFRLRLTHHNYSSLYALALASAINDYELTIRAEADIESGRDAVVQYMYVDW